MRKVNIEYDVYKYEELEKDIQESVLERYMQHEYEDYCEYELEEDMKELAHSLLEENFKGANYDNIYYDLSYSQGSGSMIAFNIDLEDLNNKYKMLSEEEIKGLKDFGGTEVKVYHDNPHYYHEYSFDIDYNDFTMYTYMEDYCKDMEKVQKKIDTIIELFKEDVASMNKELTKKGYAMLENREYFEERAKNYITELEFTEDGSVF